MSSSPSAIRLSQAALPQLALKKPGYERAKLTVGVVHFGVGGFHRAHQAMYLDALMNEGQAFDWAICGVGLLPGDERMRDALAEQDYLYTLAVKNADGSIDARVIGSIVEFIHAPEDTEAALARLADPAVRIVSLTITEGGYNFNQSTGEFDQGNPAVTHDLAEPTRPRSVFGFVVEALRRRREEGTAPFTVLSCDNIQHNGDMARQQFTAFARLRNPDLAAWVDANVRFPNCMVDRITPVTSDADRQLLRERAGVVDSWPVVCEPFTQWVLEDNFVGGPAGRPPLQRVGVQLVGDVEPYELMKLRLLNASHQALCYPGYLAGYRYAHEVCSDRLFVDYLLAYMDREGTPTLQAVPGIDLRTYKDQLIERFANPAVRDTLARLCAEASDRIPKWLVPVIHDNLAAGRPVDLSAAIVASWARYAQGSDEEGLPIEIVDQRKGRIMAAAQRQLSDDPLAFVRDRELFGDLSEQPAFSGPYLYWLGSFQRHGARTTVEAIVSQLRR